MSTITTGQFSKGMFLEFNGSPAQIVDLTFVNPGKGSAFVRTKLKSVKTGKVQEFTFKSGESAEEVAVNTREMQYLYKEGDKFIFMDNGTYEQYPVTGEMLGSFVDYLMPNSTYQMLVYNEDVIGIRFPKKVYLTVSEADEGAKGNTATGATKTVVVETGAVVTVPLFIKQGEKIAVNPETGEYLERA
jgi:elongation factor P